MKERSGDICEEKAPKLAFLNWTRALERSLASERRSIRGWPHSPSPPRLLQLARNWNRKPRFRRRRSCYHPSVLYLTCPTSNFFTTPILHILSFLFYEFIIKLKDQSFKSKSIYYQWNQHYYLWLNLQLKSLNRKYNIEIYIYFKWKNESIKYLETKVY